MKKIVVLLSGAGSTLENLIKEGIIISYVISNYPNVGGIEIAKRHSIPVFILPFNKDLDDRATWRRRISRTLDTFMADLVILAGFDQLIDVPPRYVGKILNIHPSLLPKYGGKGMYGRYVHMAVLDAKEKKSGCTVHIVDHEYDQGQILGQKEVPVFDNDTIETLTARVKEAEKELYPKIVRSLFS